jgi:hypothetical protein
MKQFFPFPKGKGNQIYPNFDSITLVPQNNFTKSNINLWEVW